jgi:hypothetical protein
MSMAGEFIKDPPLSSDSEARQMLRKNQGSRGTAVTKGPQITKSNGRIGASVGGRRVASGAASVRGGAF